MDRKTYFEGTVQVSTTQEDIDNIEINMVEGDNHSVSDVLVKGTNVLDNSPDCKVVDLEVEAILRIDEGTDPIFTASNTENWTCDEKSTVNSVEVELVYSK